MPARAAAPPLPAGVTPKRLSDTGLKRETYRAATAMECLVRWQGEVLPETGPLLPAGCTLTAQRGNTAARNRVVAASGLRRDSATSRLGHCRLLAASLHTAVPAAYDTCPAWARRWALSSTYSRLKNPPLRPTSRCFATCPPAPHPSPLQTGYLYLSDPERLHAMMSLLGLGDAPGEGSTAGGSGGTDGGTSGGSNGGRLGEGC